MLGNGNFYGRRPAGLTLIFGDFELAFLAPSYGADTGTTTTGVTGAVGGDPDSYIPRFEASYMLKLGAGYIKPFAGFQYYTVEDTGTAGTNVTDTLDVYSGVIGVSTNWNIGAFSIGGQLSYGVNEGAVTGWSTGFNDRSSSLPYLDGGDDINDVYTTQALLVGALKFTDTLRFEVGGGYRNDDADDVAGIDKDEAWSAYAQLMITLAPGVSVTPEVGYVDYMDSVTGGDQGNEWYVGAKWQIDF